MKRRKTTNKALEELGYSRADVLHIQAGLTVLDWLALIDRRAKERGMSQVDLAAALGCTRSQLNRWFRSQKGLNAKNLFALAMAVDLDASAEQLLNAAILDEAQALLREHQQAGGIFERANAVAYQVSLVDEEPVTEEKPEFAPVLEAA